ncbi:MAG: dimethylaniline monooxygenase [Planctomycetota bacterium]|nr:MAG: dimethylaniline monooxygenase [Planctomycetota bacterium]
MRGQPLEPARADASAPPGQGPERTDTVVIGAGPAGLAAAACLGRAGVPYVVLEREQQVAPVWRRHYERLCLHTVKEQSALPFMPFPDDWPRYVPRARFVEYLERYAERFGIRPRFGQEVTELVPAAGAGWRVRTAAGSRLEAERVVVATGYTCEPCVPSWPGQEHYRGQVLHSARYRNGAPFSGRRVLVVGAGNSGAEIALDLWEAGARPALSVRGPVHVVPRDLLGTPAQRSAILLSKLPLWLADAIGSTLARLAMGDLERYGLRRPRCGPLTQVVRYGRIPWIDIGTVALIKQGQLPVFPGIERFTERGVRFAGGREEEFDAVLLATGYRARLDRLLAGAAELTDERGYPRWHGREVPGRPGLYFIGFANPISGALREIALEARRIAAAIAARRGTVPQG